VAVAAAWVSVPRWSVGTLAIELSTSGDANSLEQRLQTALRDPSIQLTLGQAPVGVGDAHVTTLRTGHRTVGYLHHRPGHRLPDQLTAGLATVGAMAMDAQQMRQAAREQLAETERASQVLTNARRTEAERLALRVQRGPIAQLRTAAVSLANSSLTSGAKSSVLADLEHAIEELAVVAGGLAPDLLQSMGLRAALQSRVTASPVPVDLAIDEAADRLPPDLAYMIFLFCTEALANTAKHADASRAQITVSVTAADRVQVVVGDNGRGIRSTHGSGLRGLSDRARALGGSVTVSSEEDQGTTLRLVVPLGVRG
jgi:signal transduction histidine kinase